MNEPYELDDLVTATFRPTVTHDLTAHAPSVGDHLMVEASWVFDDGPYAGQLAWTPWPDAGDSYFGFAVPTCDLADVEIIERGRDRRDRVARGDGMA